MIRVCNVDEEGRFGGPERRIVQVAVALHGLGVETCVVYPDLDSEQFESYLYAHQVPSKKVNITRLTKQKSILIRYAYRFVWEVMMLAKFFKQEKFDLVHVNGSYQFKVALAARLAGVPVVWHLNDTYAPNLLKKVFYIVAKRCARGFIVAGKRVRDYYLLERDFHCMPCVEVHAPVNLEVFCPDKFLDVRQKNRPLRIATVASVNPAKGLEYFVEVVAKLQCLDFDVEFVVAGAILESQKAYYHFIREKMSELGLEQDRIQFVGLVDDIPAFLHEADVCVYTSVTEASPTAVWEALAMAKSVVTTDVGSVAQYIQDGVSGYIVPVADVEQLCACTLKLLNDKSLRLSMGRKARVVAQEGLSIEAAALKHLQIYQTVLSKGY